MADTRADMLQGTLDLLILKTLSLGPMHGWGVSQRIQQFSSDVLQVNQGSLYPALHRLEHRGWIASEWGASENNRRAKFYRLTPAGRRQLDAERGEWRRFAEAVEEVLRVDRPDPRTA
jgi:PadR family transcriptional regulator, regulatory protein PadR